jgi:transcriptional regulator GlxA family with amidase domain
MGRLTVVEIAVEVGFENASHFSRLFRETYGQPPSKFRSTVSS